MLPCLLAVSHCCGCYYVKCSAQCSPPAAIGRGEMDYRLARSDVILGTPPATMRIKFGINPFTPNILLLFCLTESGVNLPGSNPPSGGTLGYPFKARYKVSE